MSVPTSLKGDKEARFKNRKIVQKKTKRNKCFELIFLKKAFFTQGIFSAVAAEKSNRTH